MDFYRPITHNSMAREQVTPPAMGGKFFKIEPGSCTRFIFDRTDEIPVSANSKFPKDRTHDKVVRATVELTGEVVTIDNWTAYRCCQNFAKGQVFEVERDQNKPKFDEKGNMVGIEYGEIRVYAINDDEEFPL